jgi:hypothetical protein
MRAEVWVLGFLMACAPGKGDADSASGGAGADDSGSADTAGDSDTDSGADSGSGLGPALECPPESTDPCCAPSIGWAVACVDTVAFNEWVPGTVTSWDPDQGGVFATADGTEHELHSWSTDGSPLPSVAPGTAVEVWMQGWCDLGLFQMRAATGELLFAVGFGEAGDVGAWEIEAGYDIETCDGRDDLNGCYERLHAAPVHVRHGDQEWALLQGDAATADGYTLTVGLSLSGSGDHLCDDGPGLSVAYWWLVPAAASGPALDRLGVCAAP